MDSKDLTVVVASVLTTLAETPGNWAPSSHLWFPLIERYPDLTADTWVRLLGAMQSLGLVKFTSTTVTLQPEGLKKAQEIEARIKAPR